MALTFLDRTLTIVATATITSAIWIVGGGSLIELADSESQKKVTRPADAVPSPAAGVPETTGANIATAPPDASATTAPPLDESGASQPGAAETRSLMVPVLNVRPSDLTDTFNVRDGEGSRLHQALDILAPEGTSVVASAPGMIEKLFVSSLGGKTIYVRSGDRETIHYYAHLADYAPGLQEGQKVRRGQRLGSVGSTGSADADAPHLHFAILRTTSGAEWWEPANAVNPYPLFTNR